MKVKEIYICSQCSYQSPKWIGRCPECSAWNSFNSEEFIEKKLSKSPRRLSAKSPSLLHQVRAQKEKLLTGIQEFDQVVGQGLTRGSLTLLSGEPGIGKSTLTLQIANRLAEKNQVLIISGEESIEQIAERNQRLKENSPNLKAINDFLLETIIETIRQEKPDFFILDSIQTVSSSDLPATAGSITQIRYCTEQLMELCKQNDITCMIIGHVTKDGNLAGPKVLEHLVDTVMQLEGDRYHNLRLLRCQKNRFGSCNEVGVFEMSEDGMREVSNPSGQFLEGRQENSIGSAITVALEGNRPFLIEVQALVSTSHFGYPKRTANGFDLNRLQILIAVLEKYGKLNLQNQDIFVNVVGGVRLREPAADLAILTAIASSYLKKPIQHGLAIFGEVGLSGELRQVPQNEKRSKEAQKLGLKTIQISKQSILEFLQDCL